MKKSLRRIRQMANPEHVDKLKESVEVWNMWRYENPEISPDLWGADLEKTDLRDADLSGADLEEANLREADLGEANLMGAKLSGADIRGANLMGAMYLLVVQLCEAKTLYEAKLSSELEHKARYECPLLFEKPRENTDR
jgi:uncharacterized protein YjbI with pentapeptide repeats